MNKRASMEFKYDWRRLNKLVNNNRLKNILPDILDINGFEEQPYTTFTTRGVNTNLENSKNSLFITGPCIVASKDIKNIISVADHKLRNDISDKEYFEKLNEILDRQPSLQSILSIGACVNNFRENNSSILCIMETYEIALMLANNNQKLFEKHKETLLEMAMKTTKRIEKIIENLRRSRKVDSEIVYFYTHKDKEKSLLDDLINFLNRNKIRPREGNYFSPSNWKDTYKIRIELTYTTMFINKLNSFLKSKYDFIGICENYKHFFQIFNGTFILPLKYFGVNDKHNWIGIIPLPSPTNEREMDVTHPLFLGNSIIEDQLEISKSKIDRFSFGSYLLSFASSEDLNKREFNSILEDIFKYRLNETQKSRLLDDAKETILEKVNDITKSL